MENRESQSEKQLRMLRKKYKKMKLDWDLMAQPIINVILDYLGKNKDATVPEIKKVLKENNIDVTKPTEKNRLYNALKNLKRSRKIKRAVVKRIIRKMGYKKVKTEE